MLLAGITGSLYTKNAASPAPQAALFALGAAGGVAAIVFLTLSILRTAVLGPPSARPALAALWLLLAPVQGGGGGGDADCGAALVMTAHFPLERHLEVRDRPRNSTPHAPPTRTRAHARSLARARMHARTRPTPHMRPARSRP
jgi:hypothetical protein